MDTSLSSTIQHCSSNNDVPSFADTMRQPISGRAYDPERRHQEHLRHYDPEQRHQEHLQHYDPEQRHQAYDAEQRH